MQTLYTTQYVIASCARETIVQQKRKLRLFIPTGPLYFVSIDILGPFPKTKSGNHFLVVMLNKLSKLTKAIAMIKKVVTTVLSIFINDWVANFSISWKRLTNNSSQLMSQFFQTTCEKLAVKTLAAMGYHFRPTDESNALTPRSFRDPATTLQSTNKTGRVMLYP